MNGQKKPPKKDSPRPPDILRKSGAHEDKRRKEKHKRDYRKDLPPDETDR